VTGVLTTTLTALVLASGTATRYDPGVMDTVVSNRACYGQLDAAAACLGYVALLDCQHLGRQVWVGSQGRIGGPYLVADCAARQHRERLARKGWALDLSWELALEWNVIDDVGRGFTVWDADPRVVPLVSTVGGRRVR